MSGIITRAILVALIAAIGMTAASAGNITERASSSNNSPQAAGSERMGVIIEENKGGPGRRAGSDRMGIIVEDHHGGPGKAGPERSAVVIEERK